MRIAFTHAFCWPEVRRGGERFIHELATAVARRGHEVTILSSAFEPGTTEIDDVKIVRLRRFYRDGTAHERDFGRRVHARLLVGHFDAVHSMGRYDALASIHAAKLHRKRRTLVTDLGIPDRRWWSGVGRRDAWAVKRVVAGIDAYSCMSRWALSYLERDFGRSDGVLVPGGVSLSEFSPARARAVEPTLLYSGALHEERKGVGVLLEALPLIAASEPGVRLWLSGPGDTAPLFEKAPAEARERVDVLGLGALNQQHDRYGCAWTTVLPSVSDSFGMVLVESLACGTPVVVTNDGAPQELVTEGVTGEICTPRDPESLATACLRALELARKPGTVEACRASAEPFDWDAALAPLCEQLYSG